MFPIPAMLAILVVLMAHVWSIGAAPVWIMYMAAAALVATPLFAPGPEAGRTGLGKT